MTRDRAARKRTSRSRTNSSRATTRPRYTSPSRRRHLARGVTMTEKRPALGRGLSALIPETPRPQPIAIERDADRPAQIDLDLLVPNPRQPRTSIDEARLEELAQSIRANGIIQPILVRRVGGRYEIVAGERRWR